VDLNDIQGIEQNYNDSEGIIPKHFDLAAENSAHSSVGNETISESNFERIVNMTYTTRKGLTSVIEDKLKPLKKVLSSIFPYVNRSYLTKVS
jgi:hypothetical protein